MVRVFYSAPYDEENPGTVGTGIWIAPDKILTCAHVVAEALSRGGEAAVMSVPPTDEIHLEVAALRGDRDIVRAKVATAADWKPLSATGAKQVAEDVAILTIVGDCAARYRQVRLYCHKDYPAEVLFYGFGFNHADRATGNTHDGVTGKYLVPGVNWEEIRCDDVNNWEGYSGGPVFDVKRSILIGMLVAAQGKTSRLNMIHAETLATCLPESIKTHCQHGMMSLQPPAAVIEPGPVEDHPVIVTTLARLLDRMDHVKLAQQALGKSSFHCLVVECSDMDEPEFLAHKLKALGHLREHGLKNISACDVEALFLRLDGEDDIYREMTGAFAKGARKDGDDATIFYVHAAGRQEIVNKIQKIQCNFRKLEDEGVSGDRKLLVLVLFFTDRMGKTGLAYTRWRLRRVLGKNCSWTSPLELLTRQLLRNFVKDLPAKAQEHFNEMFEYCNIDSDIRDLLGESESIRYQKITKGFEGLLASKQKNRRGIR